MDEVDLKTYQVVVEDIYIDSAIIWVEARDEEEAEQRANELVEEDDTEPFEQTRRFTVTEIEDE
jgi:ribosomal protein S17